MESPAEYIAKLEASFKAERAKSIALENERNAAVASLEAYEARLRGLAERSDIKSVLTRSISASTAAATAELAIERLIEAEKIVEAAVEWRKHGKRRVPDRASPEECDLVQLVDARIRSQESAS